MQWFFSGFSCWIDFLCSFFCYFHLKFLARCWYNASKYQITTESITFDELIQYLCKADTQVRNMLYCCCRFSCTVYVEHTLCWYWQAEQHEAMAGPLPLHRSHQLLFLLLLAQELHLFLLTLLLNLLKLLLCVYQSLLQILVFFFKNLQLRKNVYSLNCMQY